jgi:hypothetical protein
MSVLGPRHGVPEAEFYVGAMKACVAGVSVFAAIRFGWPVFSREVLQREVRAEGAVAGAIRFTPWMIALAAVFGSLGMILLMQMLIFRFRIRSEALLMIPVAGQQVIFALAAFWIGRTAVVSRKGLSYFVPLMAVLVLSAFLALGMPTMVDVLSRGLESAPLEYRNLVWCIPTLLVSIFVIVRIRRAQSRAEK